MVQLRGSAEAYLLPPGRLARRVLATARGAAPAGAPREGVPFAAGPAQMLLLFIHRRVRGGDVPGLTAPLCVACVCASRWGMPCSICCSVAQWLQGTSRTPQAARPFCTCYAKMYLHGAQESSRADRRAAQCMAHGHCGFRWVELEQPHLRSIAPR